MKNIHFILVRPLYAGNAGSVARALKNCGFENLILVDPAFSKYALEAIRYAVGAKDLLENAKVYDSLAEAVADFDLLIGTSRRRGAYRKNFLSLGEFPHFLENLTARKVGILFGNEMNGLSNEELKICQHLVYIPVNPAFESLNLSQAVLLVAYKLFEMQTFSSEMSLESSSPSIDDLEGMYQHLTQMLSEIGFVKSNPDHIPRILRNLFGRAHLTKPEVRVIRGICRQVLWYKGKKEKEDR